MPNHEKRLKEKQKPTESHKVPIKGHGLDPPTFYYISATTVTKPAARVSQQLRWEGQVGVHLRAESIKGPKLSLDFFLILNYLSIPVKNPG